MVDNKTWLEPADDAAYVNWGPAWRIPTEEQFEELLSNTNNTWTTLNGVNGRKFTSKTDSSLSIFLPAVGSRYDSSLSDVGSYGIYWSRTLYESSPDYAWDLYLTASYISTDSSIRYGGRSVRPIRLSE